ncbi:hypothetical protein [Escherichia coli]|uniref:OspG family effector kinase n=6 Tax=Escherichia coli TaxID=562 RepID=UPI00044C134F|nr:hypothetical protein [Escherichia coli]EYV45059.1 type III effector [Escherichia coli O145:NM str. 2010C-3509]
MLSPSSVNLGCSWNSLTRNLTSPDSRILSSVRDAAVAGNVIGKGGNAVVYEDAEDATKVLKMFTTSQSNEEVTNEVRCFNQYYGAGSAEKIYGDNGDIIGIRMNKINGESLFNISSLPVQAEHAIYDMFDRLEQKGILFIDTTETNVLYDRVRNEFNPIDISSYNVSDRSWSESQIMQSYHGGKQDLISVVLSKI